MIHANQVLSKFRDGLDTFSIAVHFGITEAHAYNLLDTARRSGFHVNYQKLTAGRSRGQMRWLLRASAARRNAPVTLAAVSILKEPT